MDDETVKRKVADLPAFIRYLENTTDDEWICDIVRNKGNTKNCVMGHLINYVHGRGYNGNISGAWGWFEEIWATTYMTYPVNDGKSSEYSQDTPKQRVIAYLKDLWLGLSKPTWQIMDQYDQM